MTRNRSLRPVGCRKSGFRGEVGERSRPIHGVHRRSAAQVGDFAAMHPEVNVLALVKGDDRFVYVYDDESQELTIDAIRDHAANPALSLTWFDAVVLTNRAREQVDMMRSETAVSRRS